MPPPPPPPSWPFPLEAFRRTARGRRHCRTHNRKISDDTRVGYAGANRRDGDGDLVAMLVPASPCCADPAAGTPVNAAAPGGEERQGV